MPATSTSHPNGGDHTPAVVGAVPIHSRRVGDSPYSVDAADLHAALGCLGPHTMWVYDVIAATGLIEDEDFEVEDDGGGLVIVRFAIEIGQLAASLTGLASADEVIKCMEPYADRERGYALLQRPQILAEVMNRLRDEAARAADRGEQRARRQCGYHIGVPWDHTRTCNTAD